MVQLKLLSHTQKHNIIIVIFVVVLYEINAVVIAIKKINLLY